ncbi:MAG: hypothetical protein V9G04_07180 [Nocardioides sp.]|jgi:hypothetical protein
MMIRPGELAAIKRGEVDLAFRRWDRPRVRVGTRMRTSVGLIEVTSVEATTVSALRAADATRAGAESLAALKKSATYRSVGTLYRIGLTYAGADPRDELRATIPAPEEITEIRAWLDRLDSASAQGPWTRETLRIIDEHPGVRAPELADRLGRETLAWKADVRKLKERGLTESLAIGYRLSPRGAAVLDHGGPARERTVQTGTSLPRNIGAPATGALRAVGVTTLEEVASWSAAELLALHGVGKVAVARLGEALAEINLTLR